MTARAIVLLGKIGHGKTYLANKLCGTHHASSNCFGSCTLTLQTGWTRRKGIAVIDTPGTEADEDLCRHIGAQKVALEGRKLCGVYVVVRYACRVAEVSKTVCSIMDFVGSDDIRVIVTHCDGKCVGEDYKDALSCRLDIDQRNITLVGVNTTSAQLEDFIESTLHEPREYQVSEEQLALLSALSDANRKFSSRITNIQAMMKAAEIFCEELVEQNGTCYETDVIISGVQSAATDFVKQEKESIFRDVSSQSEEQQHLVYGRAGVALALELRDLIKSTNKMLSWDVADVKDERNQYKKCNYCGAIYIKVEGCNGETVCGNVPRPDTKSTPHFKIRVERAGDRYEFSGWVSGAKHRMNTMVQAVRRSAFNRGSRNSETTHSRKPGSTFEAGCGRQIVWSSMTPVEPQLVAKLGDVELVVPANEEENVGQAFRKKVRASVTVNTKILEKIG